ncbi:polysaccharide lyase family 8 protein [Backusella circina FSU 941]|nr:polysaccharide lyase family 8 protein [Backusella circina FSU 941]
MLLRDELTSAQRTSCTNIQQRAFAVVSEGAGTMSPMTGANLLDVSSVGINLGLLNNDTSTLATALNAFYSGVVVSPTVAGDGIQADGSFMQHKGLLYTGNYGKDYINDLLNVFVETAGTNLEPSTASQDAFMTLMQGTEWMMFGDSKLNTILWQYSTIGRMISFRRSDGQASGGIDIDVNEIEESGEAWSDHAIFENITDRLSETTTDANQGALTGTRYFYNADYMVHRAPNYVTTFKMYSSRTVNSECLNVQNPFGFHLSDGSIYTYQTGDEYVDVFGVWNWELVPGITVDYQGTPLTCSTVKQTGKQSFVGGATDGNTGIAVLDYLNPINGKLHFKKTVFFFPSGYAVQLGPVTSLNTTAPLVTVLDQRRRNGDIYVSNILKNTNTTYTSSSAKSIWHDNMGYYFPTAQNLYVDSTPRTANWASFGISSGNETSQLFTSYIKHNATTTTGLLTQYIVQPQISQSDFAASVAGTMPISLAFQASSPQVNAAFSAADKSLGMAFWTAGTFATPWDITVTSNTTCIFMFRQTDTSTYRLTVADPTQKLYAVKLTFVVNSVSVSTTVKFPTGTTAGRYTVKSISFT